MLPANEPEPGCTSAALAAWERALVEGYPPPDLQPCHLGALVDPALLDDERFRFWTPSQAAGRFGVFSDHIRPRAEQLGFASVLRHTLWHRARCRHQTREKRNHHDHHRVH